MPFITSARFYFSFILQELQLFNANSFIQSLKLLDSLAKNSCCNVHQLPCLFFRFLFDCFGTKSTIRTLLALFMPSIAVIS